MSLKDKIVKSSKVEFFNKVAGKAPSEELAVLLQQIKDQATILLEEVVLIPLKSGQA